MRQLIEPPHTFRHLKLWTNMSANNLNSIESRRRSTGSQPLQVRNFALSVLTFLALVVLLRYAQELFIPLVLSILFAYAMNPFVSMLEHFRIHRTIAAALVVITFCTTIGLGAYGLRQQATVVIDSIPAAVAKIRSEIEKHRASNNASTSTIGKLQEAAREIEKTTAEASNTAPANGVTKVQIEQPAFRANDFIWTGSLGLLGFLNDGVLVIFLVFFLLASGDHFKRKLVHLAGDAWSEKRMTVETLNEINAQIQRFLLTQILTSIAIGVCMALALWAVGFHQPAFWGTMAGAFSSVPYVGPMLVGITITIAAFLQFDSMELAAKIALIPLVIFSLEGLLFKPAIMGKAARINGVAMFVSILFWSWLWGLVGMIVAVPITIVIKTVCERVESLQPISELFDES